MNEHIKEALALFENGVPSKQTFMHNIWTPYRSKVFGDDKSTLKAIYYFVNTYNGLQEYRLEDEYMLLLQPETLKFLPKELDVNIIRKMHDDLIESMTKKQEELINSRKELVESKIEYAKGLLRQLSKELNDDNMHFSLSDDFGLDTVIIYDRVTDEEYDIILQELND